MRVEVNSDFSIILKEVYSGVGLETEEGNFLGICMRDDTFEISIMPKDSTDHEWWRVNMQTRTIEKM